MRLPLSLICAFLCISMTPGWAGQTPQARAAGADLFRDSIPALEMEISADGMNRLRKSPRQYVPATIREGATIYTNVAVHLKGGPGSFRRVDDLPALTLNFDRFADGQTFHGLKKIHLNNSVQDRSFVSEKISRELFNAAGVPTPRAGNALVRLNGHELGMYVLVEGIAVLNMPETRQRYRDRVAQLSTNVFRVEAITNRIYGISGKIAAVLAERYPAAAQAQMRRAAQLGLRFQQRANSLQRQLSPSPGLNVPRDRSRIPEGLANEDRSGQCLRSIQRTCPTVFASPDPLRKGGN